MLLLLRVCACSMQQQLHTRWELLAYNTLTLDFVVYQCAATVCLSQIIELEGLTFTDKAPFETDGRTLAETLLTPTRIYVSTATSNTC
jgi:hypothetical protein